MGKFADKAFFRDKLKGFREDGFRFFEITPAPDCCDICTSKANIKIPISRVTQDKYPPFHDGCRCDVMFLDADEDAGPFSSVKPQMKRCPACNQWIPVSATICPRCPKPSLFQRLFGR